MKVFWCSVFCAVALVGCSGPEQTPVDVTGNGKPEPSGRSADEGKREAPAPDSTADQKSALNGGAPSASQWDPPKAKGTSTAPPPQGQGPTPEQLEKASLIAWSKTVEEADEAARKDGGYVVLVFEAPWHTGSKIMKKEVFSDPETAKLLKGAHPVSIDIDDPATKDLQKEHEVTAIPVLFFLEPGKKPFGMIDGYYDIGLFQKQLRKTLKGR